LQAASSDVGLLDVDPVVIDELAGAVASRSRTSSWMGMVEKK
jgi:hypothetical protein